jgi:hypothetical protein
MVAEIMNATIRNGKVTRKLPQNQSSWLWQDRMLQQQLWLPSATPPRNDSCRSSYASGGSSVTRSVTVSSARLQIRALVEDLSVNVSTT